MAINKVMLTGRITKDIELRYTPNNVAVCNFDIAVDRRFKQGNEKITDFFKIIAWRTTAEFIEKYFSKGRKIVIVGSLQNRTWEDNEGKKHYITEVLADEVDFADSKGDGSGNSGANEAVTDDGFTDVPVADPDDLPF